MGPGAVAGDIGLHQDGHAGVGVDQEGEDDRERAVHGVVEVLVDDAEDVQAHAGKGEDAFIKVSTIITKKKNTK